MSDLREMEMRVLVECIRGWFGSDPASRQGDLMLGFDQGLKPTESAARIIWDLTDAIIAEHVRRTGEIPVNG